MNDETGVGVRVGATPEPLTEREAFEKWAEPEGFRLEHRGAMYKDEHTDEAWRAWLARAALRAPEPLTAAARRVLHELSIYKNNDPEKYGFAEDIELLARAALEGGVSPPPSSSVHQTESAGEAVQRPVGERPPTPVGWSDTDWLRHLETEAPYSRGPLPETGWD